MSQEEKTNSIPVFSKEEFIPSGSINDHDYVDLGLPSGLKWATCNIGASTPEEYGDYFAWGETDPKDSYGIDSYCFADHEYYDEDCEDPDEDPDNSYYPINSYDEEDEKKELDPEDDAAIVKWKGNWRIPAIKEFEELIDNCEWIWGTYNGTPGVKVKGPNGSSIFFPAAGRMEEAEGVIEFKDELGEYWSSCVDDEPWEVNDYWDFYCAYSLDFDNSSPATESNYREMGRSIRPVCIINKDEDVESAGKNPEVEVEAKSEKFDDEKLKASVHKAIQEINAAEKGDITLKLVSYSGSVIKMMTALSSIEGIDEDSAFNKLQKLPAVILEGISAKKAMQVGAMLEEAGATVSIENEAESRAREEAERLIIAR